MSQISENNGNNLRELVKELAELQRDLDEFISQRYHNTHPVISLKTVYNNIIIPLNFKLSDILLIGAITQSSVLLSGSSGSGKTFLAELVMQFLFGNQGYMRKNITPDMNEQDFIDIDFGAIKEGKKLKEAIIADSLFKKAGLIIDEANRAPPIIQNRLLQILENNIDLKSKKIQAGIRFDEGKYYHWNMLTLNYGDEYAGTSLVDRALKDRITLDIPIDNFPPTLDDQILMIRDTLTPLYNPPLITHEEIIYKIFLNIDHIQLNLEAEALILYLSFTSNCVKSPTGSKYGVIFSPQFCKEQDCPFARNPPLNKICPYVFAPSNRVLKKLVHVAKGFYLLRIAKIYNYLKKKTKESNNTNRSFEKFLNDNIFEVTLEDISLIAPLILHSKISMNKAWVYNNFNGNTYLASKFFINTINKELHEFMKDLLKPIVLEMKGQSISEKDKGIREMALKKDFHFKGLIKYVKKYLTI